jgi:hypothetical protein
MNVATNAKGLRHMQTVTTKRVRARPPQRGADYLDMHLLDMERQRLGQELALLDERRQRIHEHIRGIAEQIGSLRRAAEREGTDTVPVGPFDQDAAGRQGPSVVQPLRGWKTVPLDY